MRGIERVRETETVCEGGGGQTLTVSWGARQGPGDGGVRRGEGERQESDRVRVRVSDRE